MFRQSSGDIGCLPLHSRYFHRPLTLSDSQIAFTLTSVLAVQTTVMPRPPHLMTLADLSVNQINQTLRHAANLKRACLPLLAPHKGSSGASPTIPPSLSLQHKSIALIFSKRSTRTRLAAETGAALLGGRALFLGKEDIQLGVNENARDSAKVIGRMCQGIFARVGEHEEIEVSTR